jgi:hypothetical protein
MPAQAWITLFVGLLAVVGVGLTIDQRTRADNRAQSWQRITWCLDHTISADDDEAALGWTLFGTVASTRFIARTDRDTLQTLADYAVTVADSDLAETERTSDNEPHSANEEQS